MTQLRYIGHPLVDVGVATIVAAANRANPEALTTTDLAEFVDYVVPIYINVTMSNYLGGAVFASVNFANPGINGNPKFDADRTRRLREWLSLYRDDAKRAKDMDAPNPDEPCALSGDPAIVRVSRPLLPMSTAQERNFMPEGYPMVPLAGWVVLALLAMPLGTLNSGGRVLLPYTADTPLLQQMVATYVRANQQALQLQGLSKRPNYKFARTEIMQGLLGIDHAFSRRRAYPLTVYHFKSSNTDALP